MWGAGEEADIEQLVAQVKELQRTDPPSKEQWIAYVGLHGAGKRDPAKHDAEFLQTFLSQLNSGTRLETSGQDNDALVLAEAVKLMQKRSQVFKQCWASYCSHHGGGKNDPMKHPSAFHAQFLESVCKSMMSGMGMMGPPMGYGMGMGMGMMGPMGGCGAPPMKRMRADPGMGMGMVGGGGGGGMGGGGGGGMKEQLVNQVKAFQRSGEEEKELWWQYADMYLQGVRDPNRHDASVLKEFIANHDVPPAQGGGSAGGYGGGKGGCTGGMNPEKQSFMERIKAFQRSGDEEKQLWWQYADTYLEGVRDPARHDAHVLEEFCTNHDVPAAGAGGGGGGGGGYGGGGGAYAGGCMAGPADPEKQGLSDRIKGFQRQGDECKQLWWQFCGPNRDPMRHSAEKLEEFCLSNGI